VTGVRTEYEFVLPRGYLDDSGVLHKRGTMRLATARDELQPLRDPTILGPDDPRLTILVLVRVVKTLGDMTLVTAHEIEGLFAADLAYLQDFYGVINFGTDEDIDALLGAQETRDQPRAPVPPPDEPVEEPTAARVEARASDPIEDTRPAGRRSAIEEVPSGGR
jgi:hypothetical protein